MHDAVGVLRRARRAAPCDRASRRDTTRAAPRPGTRRPSRSSWLTASGAGGRRPRGDDVHRTSSRVRPAIRRLARTGTRRDRRRARRARARDRGPRRSARSIPRENERAPAGATRRAGARSPPGTKSPSRERVLRLDSELVEQAADDGHAPQERHRCRARAPLSRVAPRHHELPHELRERGSSSPRAGAAPGRSCRGSSPTPALGRPTRASTRGSRRRAVPRPAPGRRTAA